MASGITVIKGHGTGRPAKTPNPCFCMPSYNTAVFRPILLLVKLFRVHYSLEVYVVTYESLKRGATNLSNYGPRNLRNLRNSRNLRNLTKIIYFHRNIYFERIFNNGVSKQLSLVINL